MNYFSPNFLMCWTSTSNARRKPSEKNCLWPAYFFLSLFVLFSVFVALCKCVRNYRGKKRKWNKNQVELSLSSSAAWEINVFSMFMTKTWWWMISRYLRKMPLDLWHKHVKIFHNRSIRREIWNLLLIRSVFTSWMVRCLFSSQSTLIEAQKNVLLLRRV